jgi:uroporphyrinogen decarboxylase
MFTSSPRRDRIHAALAHRQPSRVPFSWGFGPTHEMQEQLRRDLAPRGLDWDRLRTAADDVVQVHLLYRGPALPAGTDEWGVVRKTVSYGAGSYEEIAHYPLAGARGEADLDAYPWPDPDAYDYDRMPRDLERAFVEQGAKAVRTRGGNPFECYTWMAGLEEALTNLVVAPDLVRAAMARITHFWEERLRRVAERVGPEVDILFCADDLGGQTGPLMSPDTYRSVLQPFHRRLFALARRLMPRARIVYHSDGSVAALVPDLIDAGIDALEALQVECAGMDAQALKDAFGGRLAFHGGISVQQLLPRADAATVSAECRRLVAILGRDGGYIAAPSHAIQVGTPTDNVMAMLAAVLGETDYAAALEVAHSS